MNIKNKLGLLTIMMVISAELLLPSCKKTEKIDNKTDLTSEIKKTMPTDGFSGVSRTKQGFIVFKTEEFYNTFLDIMKDLPTSEWDKWEESLNFKSLRTYKSDIDNKSTSIDYNSEVEDELLLTFLDQYGIVQIGDVIFKAEIDKDLVWTLQAQHLEKYADLIRRQFDASSMNIFRISVDEKRTEDVREILSSGKVGIDESGVSNKTTAANSDEKKSVSTFKDDDTYRADLKTSKQSAIFYYSVMWSFENHWKGPATNFLWFWNATYFSVYASWDFERNPGRTRVHNSNFYYTSFSDDFEYRPYAGGKKVKNGWINAKFEWRAPSQLGNLNTYTLPRNNF